MFHDVTSIQPIGTRDLWQPAQSINLQGLSSESYILTCNFSIKMPVTCFYYLGRSSNIYNIGQKWFPGEHTVTISKYKSSFYWRMEQFPISRLSSLNGKQIKGQAFLRKADGRQYSLKYCRQKQYYSLKKKKTWKIGNKLWSVHHEIFQVKIPFTNWSMILLFWWAASPKTRLNGGSL